MERGHDIENKLRVDVRRIKGDNLGKLLYGIHVDGIVDIEELERFTKWLRKFLLKEERWVLPIAKNNQLTLSNF